MGHHPVKWPGETEPGLVPAVSIHGCPPDLSFAGAEVLLSCGHGQHPRFAPRCIGQERFDQKVSSGTGHG